MTPQECADEVLHILHARKEVLETEGFTSLESIHKRIEELVGRPVWLHEMALPEMLAAEILTGTVPSMPEIIDKVQKIKPGMPVFVVTK